MEQKIEVLPKGAKKSTKRKKPETAIEVASPGTPDANRLIEIALSKGANVETMERLLAMRKELKAEWAKEEYDRAMATLQSKLPIIKKTKSVKTDKGIVAYRYSPIEDIVKQTQALIAEHGFSHNTRQEVIRTDNSLEVKAICKVTHSAGHVEETPMQVPLGGQTKVMSNSQVVAAAYSFAKRYAFQAAFGIMTAEEDTDGPDANEEKNDLLKATPEQIANIYTFADQLGLTKAAVTKRVRELYKCSFTDLTRVQADGVIEMMSKKLISK